MIIYYSGEGSKSNPEIVIGDYANLMLTYHNFHKHQKPDKRFDAVLKQREARAAAKKKPS